MAISTQIKSVIANGTGTLFDANPVGFQKLKRLSNKSNKLATASGYFDKV